MKIAVAWGIPLLLCVLCWLLLEAVKAQFGSGASVILSVVIFFSSGMLLWMRLRQNEFKKCERRLRENRN